MKVIQIRTTKPIVYNTILDYSYPHRVAFIRGTDPKVSAVASKYLRKIQHLGLDDITPIKHEKITVNDIAKYSGIFIGAVDRGRTYMFELKAHNIKELSDSVHEFIAEINRTEEMTLPF